MTGTTRNAPAGKPVFRFAPSPNGALHLGHAYSALLNAEMAARLGGRLLLRIEDIDMARCTPAFEQAIYDDLAWLGIGWEEPVRRQSEHFDAYRQMLATLTDKELVYPAFMSRGEVRALIADSEDGGLNWPRDPDGAPLYPPADKRLGDSERRRRMDAGDAFAWRLDVEAAMAGVGPLTWAEFASEEMRAANEVEARPQEWGDVVLARRDVPTSYHLAVVTDDALQGVTHVVRGEDLRQATSVHRLLQALLGLPAPTYFHHRLIPDANGRKLSKSNRDTGLDALRAAGKSPGDVRRMVGL